MASDLLARAFIDEGYVRVIILLSWASNSIYRERMQSYLEYRSLQHTRLSSASCRLSYALAL